MIQLVLECIFKTSISNFTTEDPLVTDISLEEIATPPVLRYLLLQNSMDIFKASNSIEVFKELNLELLIFSM